MPVNLQLPTHYVDHQRHEDDSLTPPSIVYWVGVVAITGAMGVFMIAATVGMF